VITFNLTADAATRFQKYTASNIGKRSAIVLDEEILSVPVIEDVIRDSGEIRGAKTVQEAEDLAVELRSGALPASIELMQQHTVEASLGADSVHQRKEALKKLEDAEFIESLEGRSRIAEKETMTLVPDGLNRLTFL
jgi:preprotein translocase subunit SecD